MTNPWEKYQASAVDSDADSGPWSAYAPVDAEPAPTRSLARSVGDSAIALGTGAVQGVKMLTDVAGAGNAASRALGTAADALTDLESPYRKAQKQERADKIKTAEASGSTWEEIKAHVGAFADAPIDTTLNALGTSLPTLAVAAIPGPGQAALATRAAQVGVGVAQGVGNIKGQVHEAVKQKHLEAGSSEVDATRRADAAQAYGGDNTGAMALGGALGGLAGSTGAESVVRRLAGRQIAGEAAEHAAPGLIRSAVTGVAKEAPMEAAQGGQERLASNVALQGEGFDVPTWQGVAGQAALEGLAAAPVGGGFGAMQGMQQRAQQQADAQARQNAEAAAADAQAKADAIIPPWSTQPGAADPSAAGATGVASAANAPAVADANFTTSPGAASLRQDGIDYQRDVDTSGLSLQDPAEATTQQLGYSPLAGTPTVFPDGSVALGSEAEFAHRYAPQPIKRSESMGIDPNAGPLSKSAALAVDSGAYMPPAGQAPAAEPEPDPVVLQNRDRTSAASIAQMQEIAANPDYLRVGPSRDMTSGAPIVFGELPPTALLGRPETVVDGHGERMGTQYAVVDALDLIASNNADGTAVAEYASGAPGKLRSVAGNGRTAGLQAAYQMGTAQRYRQELAGDAASLGVDAQALAAMQRPVLVRVMQGADVTRDMGDRTNITATQKLSPLEQAGNDARRLDVRTLSFDEGGNPTPDSIKGFVSAMPVAERGDMLNQDGTPTRQAVDRLMAATFKQAYESDELVQLYAQASDPDARAVMAAAADASGVLANLKGAGEFDVRAAVAGAAKMAVNAARQGVKLSDVLQNADLDMHPEAFPVRTTGFSPFERMTKDLTGQQSLPPRSPMGSMVDDMVRNAPAAPAPAAPAVNPAAAAAAAEAAHGERVNPTLKPNNPAFHGDGRYGAPAAPGAPAPEAPPRTLRSTLGGVASAVGNTLLYGGAAVAGGAAARAMQGVGAPRSNPSVVAGERQPGDSAGSTQIPTGGNSPAPAAQPHNFWTDNAAGRNIGNTANALAPIGGLAAVARAPGALTRTAGLADAALTGFSGGVQATRAASQQPATAPTLRERPGASAPVAPVAAGEGEHKVAPGGYDPNQSRPDLGYGPIGDRTTLTNEQAATMNPQGRITVGRGADGKMNQFSGVNVSGQVSYNDAGGKALAGGGLRGKGFSNFDVAPAGAHVAMGPGGYAFATSGSGVGGQSGGPQMLGGVDVTGLSGEQAVKYATEVRNAQRINAGQRAIREIEGTATAGRGGVDLRSPEYLAARAASMRPGGLRLRSTAATETAHAKMAHDTRVAQMQSETTQRGQDMTADASRYGHDASFAGTMYSADSTLSGKQMETQYKLRQQQMVGKLWEASGGDPEKFQGMAMRYGLSDAAKTGGEMAQGQQTLKHNAASNASKRLEGLAVRPDGKGGSAVDPGRLATLNSVVASMAPNWSGMDERQQTAMQPRIEAGANLLEGLNSQRNNGWLQAVGIDGDKPGLSSLPALKGGKLMKVGLVDGAATPGSSRGDYKIKVGGRELYLPSASVNQKELELLKEYGVDISGLKK